MYITLTPASQTHQLEMRYPNGFDSVECIDERAGQLALNDGGVLKIQEYWFGGIAIIQSTFELKKSTQIKILSDIEGRFLSSVVKGRLDLKTTTAKFKMQEGDIYSVYRAGFTTELSISSNCIIINILITETFIDKMGYNSAINLNLREQPDHLPGFQQHSIRPNGIQDLLNSRQQPYIKRLLLEAKILELLAETHQETAPAGENIFVINEGDKARLMEAKKLVEDNLRTPCSLIELSRKTGLNDFKLKKGFKILFGNTVFGYLAELRMNTARQLLQQGCSVGEVAETVGYKNAHHFTAAFKKRFAMLPSRVNKILLLLIGGMLWV